MSSQNRRQQIEEMLAQNPNDPFLRYGLGMEYVSAGDDEGAVRCFRELLAADANYVPAYLQAGQALLRLGRTAEARETFARGIEVARRQGDGHAAEEMQGFLQAAGASGD